MAKAPWETNWTPDVERFAFIFEHLQTSELAIMTEDIALPTGYALEVGWRGDKTPEIWANLILDTFGESAASFWTADKFTASFASKEGQFDRDAGLFFITCSGEVVGSAFAWLDLIPSASQPVRNGRVHFVCVKEAHRRRGLAKALVQCVLRYHRSQGRQAATLRTEAFRENAIALYESLGFRKCSMDVLVG
ncbi:mycothiol acetyltransferase-like [Sycon ciliatum]|uniref:mycothiol acetyltransferase-like n=1 Tax=Sycon ciliatum TaxID=27933 RepID=UPI0031F6CB10